MINGNHLVKEPLAVMGPNDFWSMSDESDFIFRLAGVTFGIERFGCGSNIDGEFVCSLNEDTGMALASERKIHLRLVRRTKRDIPYAKYFPDGEIEEVTRAAVPSDDNKLG